MQLMESRCALGRVHQAEASVHSLWGKKSKPTFSNARHSFGLIAVGLLESKEDIGLGPVWEHLSDDRSLISIQLSELAKVAVIVKGGGGVAVIRLVAVGSAASAASKTAATATTGASAARGGRP